MENLNVTRSNVGKASSKKVLWFSRHVMKPEQSQALIDKLEGFELVQVDGTIANAFAIRFFAV